MLRALALDTEPFPCDAVPAVAASLSGREGAIMDFIAGYFVGSLAKGSLNRKLATP